MKLNNAQLINFKNRIKFSNAEKEIYQPQIDNLIRMIERKISEQGDMKVLKVRQAGSWRKGTIIKPKDDVPIDIDLILFLNIESGDIETLNHANDLMLPMLKSIYPQKSDEDFWDNPRTAGLAFVSSGLCVDIIPVGKTRDPDYVAQPDKVSGSCFTSPKKQLEFASGRHDANPNYKTIVRILKKWRNVHDVKLSSYAIELIVAHLDINKGVQIDIHEALLRFFRLVSKKQFPVLLFNATYGTYAEDGSHVYIADPTHEENNIVKSVSDTDWNLVRIKADSAFETLLLADEEEYIDPTLDLWKEIFGSNFNINPVEN
jgi:hypothetical protein